MSTTSPHVVVIGAGFAGLTAARELQNAGVDCQIVEARDRIGGRAWTTEHAGHTVEMGANWVHWFQPYVWTEITRYGQKIIPSPNSDRAYWVSGDTVHEGTEEEMDARLYKAQQQILDGCRELFPEPFNPLAILEDDSPDTAELRETFRNLDNLNVTDLLDDTFTPEEVDLVRAHWAAAFIGDPDSGSALMAKQWGALSDGRMSLVDEITLRYKLVEGMAGIYDNIAADLRIPLRLETPVTRVEHTANGARVHLDDGEVIDCDAVISTVPVGAMDNIEFSPGLGADMEKVVEDRWNSTGFKIFVRYRGHQSFFGYAPPPAEIALFRSEIFLDDGTTIGVGFGPFSEGYDLSDPEQAERALRLWVPDIEVVETFGHDWFHDKWTGQVWGTLRRGQFTNGWSRFLDSGTRLFFAGSDWSRGWRGVCVDGAIESGLTTARKVIDTLRE